MYFNRMYTYTYLFIISIIIIMLCTAAVRVAPRAQPVGRVHATATAFYDLIARDRTCR